MNDLDIRQCLLAAVQQLRQQHQAVLARLGDAQQHTKNISWTRSALERLAAYDVAVAEIGSLADGTPQPTSVDLLSTMLRSYESRAFETLTDHNDFDLLPPQELARARGFAMVARLLRGVLEST